MARQDLGAQWISSVTVLAEAYGLDMETMQRRIYALAEQIHQQYCFQVGVNHREARPDEHMAASILAALVGSDWWMVSGAERVPTMNPYVEGCGYWLNVDGDIANMQPEEWWGCTIPDELHHGKDHVLAKFSRAEVEALDAQKAWNAQQEALVDPA